MNLVVFGATGGIGVEVVRQAIKRGHSVTAFVRTPGQLATFGERVRVIRGGESELSGWLQSPLLKISLSIRIWIVAGTILLTAAKPGLAESRSIVVASFLLGWVSSLVTLGRKGATSTISASSL